jgi:hypothetical protein
MLQYLRPRRGIRMVWVDAICINQNNTAERGSQVAKMGRIYSECAQVVLWLGSDLVLQDPGNHRRRYRLSELGVSVSPQFPKQETQVSPQRKLNIAELLERRYFSRIWVIQELILAPRILIPIGDLNFWADGATLVNRKGAVDMSWEGTKAPWFQHLAKGALPTGNFFELTDLTSKSQATDGRDRLFGVLGLYPKKRGEIMPQPDYSLSCQHVFVGFFAHCIIKEHVHQLLSKAAGCSPSHSSLTWVPEWRSQSSWEQIFQIPQNHRLGPSQYQYQYKDREYENAEAFAQAIETLVYTTSHYRRSPGRRSMGVTGHAAADDDAASPVIHDLQALPWPDRQLADINDSRDWLYLTKEISGRNASIFDYHSVPKAYFLSWFSNASINSDTGAISLNVTRLLSVGTKPSLVGQLQPTRPGLRMYELQINAIPDAMNTSIYIVSTFKLDQLMQPKDEIFILTPKLSPLVYLVLRRTADSRHFRLVAYCPFLLFTANNPIPPSGFEGISKMSLIFLQRDLAQDLGLIRQALDQSLKYNKFLGCIWLDSQWTLLELDSKLWSLLPLFLASERERDGTSQRMATERGGAEKDYPRAIKLYFDMVPQRFRPRIVDGFVHFTLPGDEWKSSMINNGRHSSSSSSVVWEWLKAGKTWTKVEVSVQHSMLTDFSWITRKKNEVTIRCKFDEIYKQLVSLAPTQLLELYRSGLLGVSDSDVEAKLRAEPVEEDYYTPSPVRPEALQRFVTSYGIDGNTYQVQIL